MTVAQEAPYHVVIGLEVHVQLLTRTKLFCGCSTEFGLPPNSATCPICIGMPGVMPVMNRRAFELSVKAALALNCQIAPFTKWDRKNYYYPDLPKNYQISQYDLPFSHDGWLEISTDAGSKRIGIIRVHLEEDAGKMIHDESGGGRDSQVDLNRTGTPLLEIVSQPDLSTPEEARAYLEEIRLLLRELGVSDCEMQEGSLRCDANVNLHVPRPAGDFVATPIIEIKNLNSFRAVERALKYEAQRQFKELESRLGSAWEAAPTRPGLFGRIVGNVLERRDGRLVEVSKATAGWLDERGVTVLQRRKEEAADYRYFPEPDLVPVRVGNAEFDRARADLGELPAALRTRLREQFGLSEYDAGVITRLGRAVARYFEETARLTGDAKEACNWISNDVLQHLNESKSSIDAFALSAAGLTELIQHVKQSGLNKQRARELFAYLLEHGGSAAQAVAALGFQVVGDESQLREIVRKAIAANPKAVGDFKKGKTKAADAIKGAIMRETKGLAKIEMVQKLLLEELQQA